MKKIIKPLIISILIIGFIVSGLFVGYRYNQGKKSAEVVSLNSYAMTDYWGDSINSYGEVTSDKAQTGYLDSGTEIISVNVSEGDHVDEGDVILTVKKETQDINSKKLEIAKAEQELKVQQIKLNRLLNTVPVPTYIYTTDTYKDYSYTETIQYYALSEFDDGYGGKYDADERSLIAEESFQYDGTSLGMTYYKYLESLDSDGNMIYEKVSVDELGAGVDITDSSLVETKSIEGTYEFLRSTTYYDYDTGKVVGEIVYNLDGDVEDEKKVPKGMNAEELSEAITSVQEEIKKQDLSIRRLNSELEEMQNTDDSGEVKAKISGTISKIQNQENYNSTQPFFVISATDEYYITGSLGEFYLDSVQIGDSVYINSWETGVSGEAVITEISDSPSEGSNNFYSGSGNSNSSSYEFKASFDKSLGIDIGSYVDIEITPSGQEESGLYIPAFFIRKDASGSYVMRMANDETLEKVYITAGKSLWGEMTEIKSGITIDDYLAFPYGNGEKEGLHCEIVDSID